LTVPWSFRRSNVYAVSRNIEAPALAKMTPMMPLAMDANNEIVRNGAAIVKSMPQVQRGGQ